MAQETILVVDDEANIVELARLYLEKEGFQVEVARDGIQALEKTAHCPPALMVLDLMLPGLDGWEVCRKIRAKSDLPIIMLTARDDDVDKIVGLEIGADDYLTKPFNPRELVARVKAILRRTSRDHRTDSPIHLSNLSIDPAARQVWVDNNPIRLRAKEFDLLITLVEHKNIVLSRDQLLQLVWGFDFAGQTRTVDMHIANLRTKLAGCSVSVETVWGIGYKLVA
ncbi:MAG: response regulator transcription factor [Anaerolineales bacterium]|nr:response regulator transcription factor [Anaerolineales bacterium]